MYKYFITIILFVFCCNAIRTQAQQENTYPNEIKFYRLHKLYDLTKWYLYCIHCDEYLKVNEPNPRSRSFLYDPFGFAKKVTYGELPLLFDTLFVKGDTVELNFRFQYKGRISNEFVENPPYWGLVFIRGIKYAYSTTQVLRYLFLYDPKWREVTPLQPAVRNYIIRNQASIDPWLRKEAKKRGVL